LAHTAARFDQLIEESQSEGDEPGHTAPSDFLRTLLPLHKELAPFRAHVTELVALAQSEPAHVAVKVDESFDPFLRERLMPLAYAYLSQAEEDLGDQLRAVLAR